MPLALRFENLNACRAQLLFNTFYYGNLCIVHAAQPWDARAVHAEKAVFSARKCLLLFLVYVWCAGTRCSMVIIYGCTLNVYECTSTCGSYSGYRARAYLVRSGWSPGRFVTCCLVGTKARRVGEKALPLMLLGRAEHPHYLVFFPFLP